MAQAGGLAVVEDHAQAYAPMMPTEALRACPSARVMTLDAITAWLLSVGTA